MNSPWVDEQAESEVFMTFDKLPTELDLDPEVKAALEAFDEAEGFWPTIRAMVAIFAAGKPFIGSPFYPDDKDIF